MPDCHFHEGRQATEDLMDDKKQTFLVCDECFDRFTKTRPVCKHCGVRVRTLTDTRAFNLHGGAHHEYCPRHENRDTRKEETRKMKDALILTEDNIDDMASATNRPAEAWAEEYYKAFANGMFIAVVVEDDETWISHLHKLPKGD